MIRLYGLKNCDTCTRAIKELKAAGKGVEFVDIRKEATAEDFTRWVEKAGAAALVNRRSTTWRGLDQETRDKAEGDGTVEVLTANPALAKRPVIEADDKLLIGWDRKTQAVLL